MKKLGEQTDIYCTYITTHPSGFFYIGKSSLRRINQGYQGSGPKLRATFLQPGFEPRTWSTKILSTHETELTAFLKEAELVPLSKLTDPYCLNTQPGGRQRSYGSPYSKILNGYKKPTVTVKIKQKRMKLSPDGSIIIKGE